MAYDRAIDSEKLRAEIGDVADKIREKGGTSDPLQWVDDFVDGIDALKTYSASDNGKVVVNGELTAQTSRNISENGTYDTTGNNEVVVAVSSGGDWDVEFAKFLAGQDCDYPAVITALKAYCFYNDTNLSDIDFSGTNLASIGASCFSGCTGLANVDFSGCPVVTVGDSAFYDCLLSAFPFTGNASLQSIGDSAFAKTVAARNPIQVLDLTGCTSLQSIGASAFRMNHETSTSVRGVVNTVRFPASLVTIGDYAFYKNVIATLDFSRCTNLQSIGASAFRLNSQLTAVDLSGCASLQSIGEYAFRECGVTSLDLSGCTALTSLGNNLMATSSSSINCRITSLDLSDCTSLQTIGEYAFKGSSMTSLTLPDHKLASIGQYAFAGQPMAQELTVNAEVLNANIFNSCSGITKITIKNCDRYYNAVCAGMSALTEAYITTTPTKAFPNNIATYPIFNSCANLTDIYVPWSQGDIAENKFVKSGHQAVFHYDTVF